MNVVVIMLDSLRPDYLGCGGHPECRTPHIDRLAREGAFFPWAYAEYPITVPSRTALVSGNYTFTNRPWCPLRSYDLHMAEFFRQAGYATGAFSDTPFSAGANMHRGFDTFEWFQVGKCHQPVEDVDVEIPEAIYPPHASERELAFFPNTIKNRAYALRTYGRACPELLFDRALDWLDAHADAPFFLWIDSFEPHEPWCPPPPYDTLYQDSPPKRYIPFPVGPSSDWMTEADLRHLLALYMGDVTHTDEQVGRVTDRLAQHGILDDTMIVVLSDHGEPFGDHGTVRKYGAPLYDELSRMVFVMRYPKAVPPGLETDALVQNTDLLPTLLDLLGLSYRTPADRDRTLDTLPTGEVQGVSLLPLLRGEVSAVRDAAYLGAFAMHTGIVKDGWKLIDNRGEKPNELFCLLDDPKERRNRLATEPERVRKLHRELWEFTRQWSAILSWRDRPVRTT